MRTALTILMCAAIGGSSFAQAQGGKTPLKVGDMAPDFTLPSTAGEFKLSDYRGKSTVVLAFFSAAFTGG